MEVEKTKYGCGHESEPVILDNNPLSITAYEEWKATVGFNGDKSQCFSCFCKEPKNKK